MTQPTTSQAIAAAIEPEDEPDQLGLFAEPETEAGAAKLWHLPRGRGRPPGARNKRTERTIAWLLARHRDPRQVLLEIAEANLADLAALAGCTLLEALQEKRMAATAVLPYVAQRQPLAVDVTNKSVVYLTITEGGGELAQGDGIGLTASIVENVEYQEVSGGEDAKV